MNIGAIPRDIDRVITEYPRLDLGVPVVGEYKKDGHPFNKQRMTPVPVRESETIISSLVPGVKYRILVWGLGGGDDRRRSQSPAVREVTTMERSELMHSNAPVCMYMMYIICIIYMCPNARVLSLQEHHLQYILDILGYISDFITDIYPHGRRKEIQNGGALKLLDRADSSMRNKHHEVVLIVSSELELN